MRQRYPLGGARGMVEIEVHAVARGQGQGLDKPADPQLRALQVGQHPDRPADLALDAANEVVARPMFGMAAVAEIEAEHVRSGIDQGADGRGVRARRPQGRHDLGPALARLGHLGAASLSWTAPHGRGQKM